MMEELSRNRHGIFGNVFHIQVLIINVLSEHIVVSWMKNTMSHQFLIYTLQEF